MHLQWIDWVIAFACVAICFVPGALLRADAPARALPSSLPPDARCPGGWPGFRWWPPPSAATRPTWSPISFAARASPGTGMWWAFTLTGVATVFFYARLWRRSGVMTDLEFYEIRYSGKARRVVRGFRAVYLGLFFNCMIMAVGEPGRLQDRRNSVRPDRWQTLLLCRRAQRHLSRRMPGFGACWSST